MLLGGASASLVYLNPIPLHPHDGLAHSTLHISNNWQIQANSQAGAFPQRCTKAIHLQPNRMTTFLLGSYPFMRPSIDPDQIGAPDLQISWTHNASSPPGVRSPISPFLATQLPHALEGLVYHLNMSSLLGDRCASPPDVGVLPRGRLLRRSLANYEDEEESRRREARRWLPARCPAGKFTQAPYSADTRLKRLSIPSGADPTWSWPLPTNLQLKTHQNPQWAELMV